METGQGKLIKRDGDGDAGQAIDKEYQQVMRLKAPAMSPGSGIENGDEDDSCEEKSQETHQKTIDGASVGGLDSLAQDLACQFDGAEGENAHHG